VYDAPVRQRLACAVAAVALFACSSSTPNLEPLPRPTPGVAASATASAAAPTPDEILQARLRAAVVRMKERPDLQPTVRHRLPVEEVGTVLRASRDKMRGCYEKGLQRKGDLHGLIRASFVIELDGTVSKLSVDGDLPDQSVVRCVTAILSRLVFPKPVGGTVKIVYPVTFAPGDPGDVAASPAPPNAAPVASSPEPSTPGPSPYPPPDDDKAATVPSDPEGPWPIVVVDATSVRLAGAVVGDTKAIHELGRPQLIHPLADALNAQRKSWKEKHPGQAFPGVVGMRADPDASVLDFKSVFESAAIGGGPYVYLQSPSSPSKIVELIARVPLPFRESKPEPKSESVLNVRVEATEMLLTWRVDSTVVSDEKVGRERAAANKICESWQTHGRYRDPTEAARDWLIVHAAPELRLRDVAPILQASESCTREVRDPSGAAHRAPVFWTLFSIP